MPHRAPHELTQTSGPPRTDAAAMLHPAATGSSAGPGYVSGTSETIGAATETTADGKASRVSMSTAATGSSRPTDTHGSMEDERLGRYRLLRLVGQGGMGVVYVAYDELLDRRVAIKRVRAGGSDAHERILYEAKALAQLSHPNVVPIFEVSASAGRIFIAMEYVPGHTLRAWTERWRADGGSQRELLDMFIQAGRGLAAAHAQGLVHRDFKPENVLVGEDGRARVVDFGLVTSAGDGATRNDGHPVGARIGLTVAGSVLGTPSYMSPEQFDGCTADARSDQFSYCIALYEALCGARPFAGESFEALCDAVTTGAAREPGERMPEWLWAILRRGLATAPEDRFATMDELLAHLAVDPLVLRRQRLRVAALAVTSAIATVLVVLLVADLRERWQRRELEQAAERSLASTERRIVEARAADDPAAAARVLAAFVDDPLHEGTRALTRAWLGEATRRRDDGDAVGARSAFAAAYLRAVEPDAQRDALVGLAALFRARLEWDALASIFALLDRDHPGAAPQLAGLRVEGAFGRRDFAGARASLAQGDPASLRALAGVLASGHATPYVDIDRVEVAGDRLLLFDPQGVHVAARAPGLPGELTLSNPAGAQALLPVAGEPLLMIGNSDANSLRNTLYRVEPGGFVPLFSWDDPQPFAAAAADLDGDGARELYVGTGVGLEVIALTEREGGGWARHVVYTAADTLQSAVKSLVPIDLDGDGRDELAAAFTSWRAYDVRVLRLGPGDPRLRTVARDKLGTVIGIAPLRGPGGARWLLAGNTHQETSVLTFPPGRPQGEAEGLYLYTFEDDRLARQRHLPLPLPDEAIYMNGVAPLVGDANGDGRDDIAVDFHLSRDKLNTLLYLQEEDGEFSPIVLGSLRVLTFIELDGDPGDELVVSVPQPDGERRVWVLGAGDDVLVPATSPPVLASAPELDDPTWNRTWRHAETLQSLGLVADAAAAFADLGRRASRPASRALAYFTAGALHERAGHEREAVPLLHAAAQAPELAVETLQRAMRAELRLGDYTAAARTIAALADLPGLDGELREALARRWGPLAAIGQQGVDVSFDRPLAPAWRIENPLTLKQRPETASLVLAGAETGVHASLPVEWPGELIDLSVDLTIDETEWSSRLQLAMIRDDAPDDDPLALITVHTSGTSRGGVDVTRVFACGVPGKDVYGTMDAEGPLSPAVAGARVTMRVAVSAALGQVSCELTAPDHGVAPIVVRESLTRELPPAGRYRLVLRTSDESPAFVSAELHSLRLRGVRPVDAPPADPIRAELGRALLRGDPVAGLAALDALGPLSPREQVWRAHALRQVGRGVEARALWAALLADPGRLEPALVSSLRAQPELLGPLLHELDLERYLTVTHALWRNTALNHLRHQQARGALLSVLDGLDVAQLRAQARTPEARARASDLLAWRARAYLRGGEQARARPDLEHAIDLAAGLDQAQAPERWLLWLDLASLAAAEGDRDGAREAVRRARADGDMPLLVSDVVRARPELAALE